MMMRVLARVALVIAAMLTAAGVQPVLAQDAIGAAGQPGDAPATAFYGAPTLLVAPLFAPSTGAAAVNPPMLAPPVLATASIGDRARAVDCMSWAIAYEAASQPIAGQEAVGQVILNRLHDPRRPKTVCGVVFQGAERRSGCQFTFACDGSLRRHLSDQTMTIARSVAAAVLDGAAPAHVGGATNYHANYVSPVWATTGRKVAQIGAHIFYEMPGDAGRTPTPMATVGEPPMVLTSVQTSVLDRAPTRARLGRHARQAALMPRAIAPASAHSMFQPWGLPVAGQ